MTPIVDDTTIFQTSDLNRKGKDVMDAARAGRARIRDKDGSSFVLVPESYVRDFEHLSGTAVNFAMLTRALAGDRPLDLGDYGDWAWLEHLDPEDLAEFIVDVREAFIRAVRTQDSSNLRRVLHEWRSTAVALADSDRREVLLGATSDDEFVEVAEPVIADLS
jgi:hypothetical protein